MVIDAIFGTRDYQYAETSLAIYLSMVTPRGRAEPDVMIPTTLLVVEWPRDQLGLIETKKQLRALFVVFIRLLVNHIKTVRRNYED